MMRVFARSAIALTALAMLPAIAFAQAALTGVVKDTSGAVLPGVTVEAASPAIIEKVRTAVTDGSGQFRITELRPGAYTVTFTLPGFNTVKRDGITLTGAFTASVDAELRVGSLEETITVTGEAPIVDVQSATRQRVMDTDTISALPTGRNMFNLGVLIPGVTLTGGLANQDVGGSLGPETRSLIAHGGRQDEQRFMMNGVSLSSMIGGGWGGGAIPNATGVQEMVFDTAAVSADLATGGVRINFIAREGGNQYHGTLSGGYANSSFQGNYSGQPYRTSNISDALLARNPALRNSGGIDKNWDLNPGFGGPLMRDKAWFFVSGRYQGAYLFVPGMFYNANANNPARWDYAADQSSPASLEKVWQDGQLRLSVQVTPRNKIGLTYQQQVFCGCHDAITATVAPEAATDRRFPVQRPVLLDWTSPVTNKLLLEASGIHRVERWGNMHLQEKGFTLDPQMIGVLEQGGAIPGLAYRGRVGTYNNSWNKNFHWRANVSYITGAHAFKIGANSAYGHYDNLTYNLNPIDYRFLNGVPNQLTIRAIPDVQANSVDQDTGIFVQDKWTLDRLTVSLGLRYDHFTDSFPEQNLGPTKYTPTRNLTFPATKNLNYQDITPKMQVAYDLFGTGKTALKASVNKYLQGLGTTGTLTSGPNPIALLQRNVSRAWTDGNGNFVPDCDVVNPAAQDNRATGGDFCGAFNDAAFGRPTPSTTYDPALLTGWGKRNFNWEFSTSVQHEIVPRVSVDVGYFRRLYGNFLVTDNRAVSAAEYDTFSVVAPADARLPGGGGYTVSGFRTLNPSAFGRASSNLTQLASNFGKQYEHWNGVDVNVNARLSNGITLQGGTGTGRTATDNCEIASLVPEAFLDVAAPGAGAAPTNVNVANSPYCHVDTRWLTQVKGVASYTVPKIDVSFAATYQNIPGPEVAGYWAAPSATIAQSLNRPLAGGAANQTVNLVAPGTAYSPHLNQLDLRFGKILRFGTSRATINFDIYNLMNSGTILALNSNFALPTSPTSWQAPTSILQARFFKFGGQIDW
jgi:hypothetical protein